MQHLSFSNDLCAAMEISSAACAIISPDGFLVQGNAVFQDLFVQSIRAEKEPFHFDHMELQAANYGKPLLWEDMEEFDLFQPLTLQVDTICSPSRVYRMRLGKVKQQDTDLFICFFSDITSQTVLEARLAERDSLLERIINEFPMMICGMDNEGIIKIWNHRCVELTGYTALEMINNPDALSLLLPNPRVRYEILDKWRNRAENVIRHWNMEISCRDHSKKTISWTVRYREKPILPKLNHWGIGVDVTATVRAIQALRESEERLSIISKATNDAVYDWDFNTQQLWWNEGVTQIFGYDQKEVDSSLDWWLNNVHPNFRESVNDRLSSAIESTQEFWSDEYPFLRKDGTYAYVLDKGYFIRNSLGKVVRMIGGMSDITREKEWERIALERDGQLIKLMEDGQERLIDATVRMENLVKQGMENPANAALQLEKLAYEVAELKRRVQQVS
jgi:PAS domain S-box-containing protein